MIHLNKSLNSIREAYVRFSTFEIQLLFHLKKSIQSADDNGVKEYHRFNTIR